MAETLVHPGISFRVIRDDRLYRCIERLSRFAGVFLDYQCFQTRRKVEEALVLDLDVWLLALSISDEEVRYLCTSVRSDEKKQVYSENTDEICLVRIRDCHPWHCSLRLQATATLSRSRGWRRDLQTQVPVPWFPIRSIVWSKYAKKTRCQVDAAGFHSNLCSEREGQSANTRLLMPQS